MTYYALELVNLKNEKPEVMEALIKGAFSINRSGNAFAGVAVDMDYLFNLRTGKQVTKVAEMYLLNVMKEGKRQRDAFISECQEDTKRFEKPIRKVKVNNFTTANFIKRNKSKEDQKLAEAKGTPDIFGRLLF